MLLNFINIRNILFLTLLLIVKILLPSISFADADKVFKENNKAVVVIIAYDQKGNPISQGSGFIVRQDGAIVTNYHVISNAKGIAVKAGEKVLIEGQGEAVSGEDLTGALSDSYTLQTDEI